MTDTRRRRPIGDTSTARAATFTFGSFGQAQGKNLRRFGRFLANNRMFALFLTKFAQKYSSRPLEGQLPPLSQRIIAADRRLFPQSRAP